MSTLLAQLLAVIRIRPFVAGCVALTVLLGAGNVFLWQWRQATTQKHDEVRQQGEHLIYGLSNRPHIETDLAALRAALALINRDLLDEQSMEANLGYFYRLEKITRVQLARLNQLAAPPPVVGGEFKSLPFSMQVTGSYRNNMVFLRALETGPHILRVRSCSVERQTADSGDVTMDLTVEVLAKL